MGQMKTPGVYVVEKNAFPNSVVEVATAVPAFIGYTQKADNKGKSLSKKPWRISSMGEFHQYYGYSPEAKFTIEEKAADSTEDAAFRLAGKEYVATQPNGKEGGRYLLYFGMLQFFQNGGGPCYIVSVGDYADEIDAKKLTDGIETLIREQEPTMVVIPDAVLLAAADCISVQQAALAHCGGKMKNRMAILDVWGGHKDRQDPSGDCIEQFRSALGINYLDYAAAYYPWVNTTIVQDRDVNFESIANLEDLQGLLRLELGISDTAPDADATDPSARGRNAKLAQQVQAVNDLSKDWSAESPEDVAITKETLNKSLVVMSPLYNNVLKACKDKLNLLPPSAAMAGIYTMVDNARGVWKAPANVSLSGVTSPAVNITHDDQEDLNVTTQGKSINAIRSFVGEGTLVWGARTLDGNSLDWRYISVRRTMLMLEESIKLASKAYVFESNDANTWVTIKSMVRNFLTGIWKRGGLAGASPDDAFSVFVGLGETMTPEDILEGILRVTVLVALTRPAEFIEITFQQQMQKS